MNLSRVCTAVAVCVVTLSLFAQGAPPPPAPVPSPLTGYTGRFLDSSATTTWFGPNRTLRADTIHVAPELDRIFVKAGNGIFGAYVLSTFPGRVAGGPTSTGAHGEQFLRFDMSVNAEDPRSGWSTVNLDGDIRLVDFDWDRRGYVYLAYTLFGWGIVDPQGHKMAQLNTAIASKIVSFATNGHWYVAVTVSGNSTSSSIYDVTDPGRPIFVRSTNSRIIAHDRNVRGDAIALIESVNGGNPALNIYSPEGLLSGVALQTFDATPCTDLASDGRSFYCAAMGLLGGEIRQMTPSSTGVYSDQRIYSDNAMFPTHISYGAGYLALIGFSQSQSPALAADLLRFDGSSFAPTSITPYMASAYGSLSFISPNGVQPFAVSNSSYVAFGLHGIGDVFSLLPAVRYGTIAFSAPSVTVSENAGTALLTVSRTEGSDGAVAVPYTITPGTAVSGGDFTGPLSGTLSFAAGETSKVISVPIVDDNVHENDETFTVSLGSPSGGALLGFQSDLTVLITDNDPVPVAVIADRQVLEADTVLAFTITLSNPSAVPASIFYSTADGTALGGADYTPTSGTAVFAPGVTEQTINVAIHDDLLPEGNETFSVNLSSPVGATLGRSSAIGTILDDEADLKISLSAPTGPIATGSTISYSIRVDNLGPGSAQNVSVTIPLPAGATFVSAAPSAGSCTGTNPAICTISTLAMGSTFSSIITVKTPSTRGATTLAASVAESGGDANLSNNTASAVVNVIPIAEIPTLNGIALLVLAAACAAVALRQLRI